MTNTKVKMVLKMFFFKFNNTDMRFDNKMLIQKFYTANKIVVITNLVKIVDLTKFIIAAYYADSKMFVVHMIIRK